ncbi:MAG: 3-hydroxyacyl-CoA dehydrogenase NAD-binding domain-containing protein [Bifidobacterium aquikefiri]|uniref:Diguanylate cyclase n=1 Tax=Bifidobacterium aquikefiri TaxID=1653207 RepID=A0A261G8P6_9BIFI|nr:3-hydroxyacyl-CoA dehydrogenase NAD-binding domain-containing protein [Bifidobacterium aquikefiri]OZG67792.1 diguanylate cyclase [Bifidobacterium aquikefiri]
MAHATVFGKGNMGSAIAKLFESAQYSVQVLDSSASADENITGEIVVLAVPYAALSTIVDKFGKQLKGLTVVDITNPVDFSTMDSLLPAPDSSAAAELADILPDSKVIKAFNTNFVGSLVSAKVGDNQTTVLIAGDDEEAKNELATVVKQAGLDAVDAGSLKRARELESFGFLQLALAVSGKLSFNGGFAVLK